MRFEVPLYTVADAARIVDVAQSTLASWAKGYTRRPSGRAEVFGDAVVTSFDRPRGEPSIPFVGLAESLVLAAFRRSGVPMQRIRPALRRLARDIGVEHALAARKLYSDGADVLYDYGSRVSEASDEKVLLQLVVVRSGQTVFTDVIESYLKRIEYAQDGYASRIRVPAYDRAAVVADPSRAFGSPTFERGGARVRDVLERFWAGESLEELNAEFGVPLAELEDVVRVTSRRAA